MAAHLERGHDLDVYYHGRDPWPVFWEPQWEAPSPLKDFKLHNLIFTYNNPKHLPMDVVPFGDELITWSKKDVARMRVLLPDYKIYGPGKVAICHGQSGLFGAKSRRISKQIGVHSVQEAAQMCDAYANCTHFSVTVGPDHILGRERRGAKPFTAEFCKGPLISMQDVDVYNTFTGLNMPRLYPHQFKRKMPGKVIHDGKSLRPAENAMEKDPLAASRAAAETSWEPHKALANQKYNYFL